MTTRLETLGVHLLDLRIATASRCSKAYADYLDNRRKQTGLPAAPKSPLPDFFIGAHAAALGFTVATADTGRYHSYFPEVQLLSPA